MYAAIVLNHDHRGRECEHATLRIIAASAGGAGVGRRAKKAKTAQVGGWVISISDLLNWSYEFSAAGEGRKKWHKSSMKLTLN